MKRLMGYLGLGPVGLDRAVLWLIPLGLAALLALSGCGSSDNGVAEKSGKEILAASKAAAEGADSVHVLAKSAQGRLTFSSDLELGKDEARAKASFLGLNFEVIQIGHSIYAKGSQAFYARLLGSAADVPQGTWLKGSANSGKLGQLTSFTELAGQLNRLLSTSGPVTKGTTTTVNGQKAIELKEVAKLYKGTLYVATTGKPYPIALVKSGRRETGRTTFSAWDEDVSISAPSPSVDVSTLEG